MNIISFILVIIAIVIFALASRGHQHGSIALGLAFFAAAWAIQTLWANNTIKF